MMIRSGRWRGHTAKLHQWANDWITADLDDPTTGARRPLVLRPTQVALEPDEIETMRASVGSPSIGQFWRLWTLNDNGIFTARPRNGG